MPTATRYEMTWTEGRWHLDGRPIHAGDALEMQFPDYAWLVVRVESADSGRKLFAHFEFRGLGLCVRVDPNANEPAPLRWIAS